MTSAPDTLIRDVTIDADRVVTFMGPDLRVYGTPFMLADAEMACRDLLLAHLGEGVDSVGVQLQHSGAAIEGDTVRVHTRLKSFDGRKADFQVEVFRGDALIGSVGHQRAAVPLDMLRKRVASLVPGKA